MTAAQSKLQISIRSCTNRNGYANSQPNTLKLVQNQLNALLCVPIWFALILSVFSSLIKSLTRCVSLSSSSFTLPVPLSFHSPASLSNRYNLHFLQCSHWSQHIANTATLMAWCDILPHAYTSNKGVSVSSPVLVSTSCNWTTGVYSAAHSSSLAVSSSSSLPALVEATALDLEVSTPVKPAKPLPVPKVEADPKIGAEELASCNWYAMWNFSEKPLHA